jgi:hypothetical protein
MNIARRRHHAVYQLVAPGGAVGMIEGLGQYSKLKR